MLLSQQIESVHEAEHNFYKTQKLEFRASEDASTIIPLQFDKSAQTGTTIFGYLPYWEYSAATWVLRYDILTHLAAFSWDADSLGNLSSPGGWPWTNIINNCHNYGVKVILTVVNFNSSHITGFLTDSTKKQRLFNNILSQLNTYQLDGVNIDFENLNTADRGTRINNFMAELTAFIKAARPSSEVSFAAPAVNWAGWNFAGLANSCDYLFIMGYDFYGSWSTNTGPNAPYSGGFYNILNTVNSQYSAVVNSAPEKLILGVPYFGAEWIANTQNEGSTISSFVKYPRFKETAVEINNHTRLWSTNYSVPWYRYPSNDKWRQIWYDDSESLALKFNLAKSKNFKGIGMWALNYDGTRTELWQTIEDIFINPSSIRGEKSELNSYILSSVFPNPFNPTTKLRVETKHHSDIVINLYNSGGMLVKQVFSGSLSPGVVDFEIEGSNLSSGVYFAVIRAVSISGSYFKTLKLTLIK